MFNNVIGIGWLKILAESSTKITLSLGDMTKTEGNALQEMEEMQAEPWPQGAFGG